MAIPTSRTKETAKIFIDEKKCNSCGVCVTVCKDFSLELGEDSVKVSDHPLFGCYGCGQCMAVCPKGAIEISGRELTVKDTFDLPAKENAATYDSLVALLERRRSIRDYKDKPIEAEVIQQILDAARKAPMGLPPSDVHVMVLNGKDKTRAFAEDYCRYLKQMKWLVSNWFLTLMRPFWGKANDSMFRGFLKPLIGSYIRYMEEDVNLINYDAPLAMYFYGSPFSDPADPIVAATYAMIAAESLGLSTCMLGAVHPFIQNGKQARKFRERHNIKYKSKEGLFVSFGYSSVKFKKGIRRSFASVVGIDNYYSGNVK